MNTIRFIVGDDPGIYRRSDMLEASADDNDLNLWVQSAKPGDYYPDGEGCDCIDEAALCARLKTWCDEQGLPLASADELAAGDVTPAQRAWLCRFVEQWDAYMEEARHELQPARARVL